MFKAFTELIMAWVVDEGAFSMYGVGTLVMPLKHSSY